MRLLSSMAKASDLGFFDLLLSRCQELIITSFPNFVVRFTLHFEFIMLVCT